MKLVLIIPTFGRKDILHRLLVHLEGQSRPPDEVIVTAPDTGHVPSYQPEAYRLTHVYGARGLCAQRNRALELAEGRFDIITFFDDDFVPADDYIGGVIRAFEDNPSYAVLMGDVLRDGAREAGFSFDQGCALLRAALADPPDHPPVEHPGAYGCNMSMRAALVGQRRFDERLVLYGWQEDIDFTSPFRRHGRIMRLASLTGVHLGFRSGRVSGVRFGYSQIINPIYLARKGTMPLRFASGLIARNLLSNLIRSIRPEAHVDRRGRLKGNLLGATHLLTGRIEPEYILKL
ncbi:glycosyltransferase family 2 protein [Xanthobacteraceae bacterium A53D]